MKPACVRASAKTGPLHPVEHVELSRKAIGEAQVQHSGSISQSVSPDRARRVTGVEVGRSVIIEVHRDHDPEEAADGRHLCGCWRTGRSLSPGTRTAFSKPD